MRAIQARACIEQHIEGLDLSALLVLTMHVVI